MARIGSRVIALQGAVAMGVLAFATPAHAVSWGTLYAKEGDVTQGRGYGTFTNHSASHAKVGENFIDNKRGGDGIFVDTKYYFYYVPAGQSSLTYTQHGSDQSSRTTSGDWVYETSYQALHNKGQKARGNIKVCEDHSFGSDPCSKTAYPTFDY